MERNGPPGPFLPHRPYPLKPETSGVKYFLICNGSTWQQQLVFTSTGYVGIGTSTPQAALDIYSTNSVLLPRGTTAQQPGSPVNGMVRYNTSQGNFEGYQSGSWLPFSSGGSALPAGSTTQIQFNSGGAFGASSNLLWNNASSKMTIGGAVTNLDLTSTFIATTNPNDLMLGANNLSILYVSQAKRVGINLAPSTTLEVFDPSQATIRINSSSLSRWDIDNPGDLRITRNLGTGNFVFSSAYKVSIGTSTPQAALDIYSTDSVLLPRGTTAQQPGSPVNGMIRYNSTKLAFEGYQGGSWLAFASAKGPSTVVVTTISTTGALTLTAAQMVGGVIIATGGTAGNWTTDTAANIIAAIPNVDTSTNGSAFYLNILNKSGVTKTMVANTGVTLVGTAATMATDFTTQYLVQVTGAASVTMTKIGTLAAP